MKKFKKFFAVLLTLAMVLGMSMTTFAAAPSNNDHADITIKGITDTDGLVIKAYRIVEPEYATGRGLTGYKVVSPYSITDQINFVPTPGEISTIAGQAASKTPEYTLQGKDFAKGSEGYVANVTAGEYLIVVESTNFTYNPMVVSAAYGDSTDSASLGNSSVDATTGWKLQDGIAFTKSSEVKTEKTVDKFNQEVGETVNYTVKGTIPSYSSEYTNPIYTITDEYTNLEEVSDPTVTIGGKSATKDTDYELEKVEGTNKFTVKFLNVGSYAAKSKAERDVVITYTAKIAASASTINPATNKATLNYSNKPNENKNATPSNTYTYTFDINGEFEKTGENNAPLEGSTFTLYKADGSVFGTCVTNVVNGKALIHFEDVAEGTYTMKETDATDGYSLNDTVYTVTIKDVTYDKDAADKKVTGYTVEVKEGEIVKGTYVYNVADGTVTPAEGNSPAIVVQNTKLASLPSTGGIGTTIFTIGGCAIMIIAAGLFFASRRRSAK